MERSAPSTILGLTMTFLGRGKGGAPIRAARLRTDPDWKTWQTAVPNRFFPSCIHYGAVGPAGTEKGACSRYRASDASFCVTVPEALHPAAPCGNSAVQSKAHGLKIVQKSVPTKSEVA